MASRGRAEAWRAGRAPRYLLPDVSRACFICRVEIDGDDLTCAACAARATEDTEAGQASAAERAAPAAPTELAVGQILAGCAIEALLGQGAMGLVYRARRLGDLAPVVVKVMRPEARTSRARERFSRECSSLARLAPHPNIVRVLAVDDGEPPCLVLELVEGPSLLDRLEREGPLPWKEAVRIARDVARGLAAIHRQGVTHRDVKPDNVRMTPAGQPKLVDFGLVHDEWRTALTAAGAVVGTPAYVAPELWLGGECGPATDVYALGATLTELITGELAFGGEVVAELYQAVLTGQRRLVRASRPEVPEDLELVLEQALDRDARRRYQSADDLAEDLERLLHGISPSAPRLVGEGRELTLLGASVWRVGRAPTCALALTDPAVEPEHAEVRREAGYVVQDLGTRGGTWVDGERAAGPVALVDGARLRVGATPLRFVDPRSAARPAPLFEDVERVRASALRVEAACRAADASAAVALLERALPDRWELEVDRERLEVALGGLPPALAERQAAAAADEAHRALERLSVAAGAPLETPEAALGWWDHVRAALLPAVRLQVVAPALDRVVRLRPAGGGPSTTVDTDRGILLLGEDPRCHVTVPGARHVATFLRLDRRLVVRGARGVAVEIDGAPRAIGFLDPGSRLTLGAQAWLVEAFPVDPPDPSGWLEVSAATFWALADLGHAATLRALRALLSPGALRVSPGEDAGPGAFEALEDLRGRARAALAAFSAGLEAGRAPALQQLGSAVAPRGVLAPIAPHGPWYRFCRSTWW